MTTRTDILIIGGGMAGSLCALVMAEAGFAVTLVEKAAMTVQQNPRFDGRTTAIASACQRLLDRLGLWEPLRDEAGPIHDILVTDGRPKDRFRAGGPAAGFLHFDSRLLNDAGAEEALGWIVENRRLRTTLLSAVEAHQNIIVKAPATWTRMETHPAHKLIHFEDGTCVEASLIIAADGRASPVRRQAGIKTTHWSYNQTGIVCTVAFEKDHQNIAQEYFLPGGPFAVLPLPENRASLVWTEKNPQAEALCSLSDTQMLAFLEERFGPYLGTLQMAGPVWTYPLNFHLAEKFFDDRIALIGDAAHGIHPIAGQGFNLGIKDIAALRDVLLEAQLTGLDIGHGAVLERYQRWRHFDTASLSLGTDLLNRLFSNDNSLLRTVRSTGLGLVNQIRPLRKFFMRHAGGDAGDLPQLLRS